MGYIITALVAILLAFYLFIEDNDSCKKNNNAIGYLLLVYSVVLLVVSIL